VFNGSPVTLGDGTVVTPSDGVYTLPRTIYTNNATVDVGQIVALGGYQWFDNGTLTNDGSINDDGIGSTGRQVSGWYGPQLSGGQANASSGDASGNILGAPFGKSQTGAPGGTAGGIGTAGQSAFCGGGGGGGENAGLAGGAVTAPNSLNAGILWPTLLMGTSGNGTFSARTTAGSGGGGGGIGSVGADGNGGAGGGWCTVCALAIAGTGSFSANGAAGEPGSNTTSGAQSGGGGGGGGGGGLTTIVAGSTLGFTGTITANGGPGGAGGTGPGTPGGNGGAGDAGGVYVFSGV
jgi:hypothetical protein